jgi:hypothetical protein
LLHVDVAEFKKYSIYQVSLFLLDLYYCVENAIFDSMYGGSKKLLELGRKLRKRPIHRFFFCKSLNSKTNNGADNPSRLKPPLLGFLDIFCFFYGVGLSNQFTQHIFDEWEKFMHYPGIKPSTFAIAFGNDNHCTI